MKVLNISLDKKISDKNSAGAKRMVEYKKLVDKYTVVSLDDKKGKLKNFFKIYFEAKKFLKQERYDVITVQDVYFVGWLAVKLAKKFNIALEIQVHGFEKFSGIRKILAKKILRNADAIRVVSQGLSRKLVNEFKLRADKITVVPIYTEHITHNIEPGRRTTHNDGKFVFLTVGRLVPVKNIEMQIRAIKKLRIKNYELRIVGDGPLKKRLEIQSEKLGIADKIKFLGWQDNLAKFYSQVDAFLLTSNAEGWGMVVVEAAQFSLPIIMTDVGLAGEVIKDGESGIVIPVGDQKALEESMVKLIEDKDLRQKLGEGAREAIKKLPTREETLALYLKSWQKAIKK